MKSIRLPWNVHNTQLKRQLFLHRGQHLTGTGAGRDAAASSPDRGTTAPEAVTEGQAADGQGQIVDFTGQIPINEHPDRDRMQAYHNRKGLARKIHNLLTMPGRIKTILRPPLSEEEQARIDEEHKQSMFLLSKIPDVQRMGKAVLDRLTRLQFMNIERGDGKRRRVHRVRPDMFAVDYPNANVYQMSLRVQTLPIGVQMTDIIKDETLDECLPLTQMPLRGELKPWGTIIKGYPGGLSGLPTVVTCQDAWDHLPPSSSPYTVNIGLAEGGIWRRVDLTEAPHTLIAGASGQGKSNLENYLLCSLLRKGLAHNMINLALFDLKDGVELSAYEHVPYLMNNEKLGHVIYNMDEVLPAIKELERLMHQRAVTLRERGVRSVREYNLGVGSSSKMPVVFVFFDEFATPVVELKRSFLDPMIKLSNMSRFVGIHFVFATQHPKAEILDSLIAINFQLRMAFKMPGPASQSMLGNWRAEKLGCKGRVILQNEGDDTEVQTPIITKTIIDDVVHFSISGEKLRRAAMVDEQSLLDAALEKFDGMMETDKLYEHFKGRKVGHNRINRMLQKMDGNLFVVNGTRYRVVKPARGPRRMVPVSDDENVPVETPDIHNQ
jgi:hypothetical protein